MRRRVPFIEVAHQVHRLSLGRVTDEVDCPQRLLRTIGTYAHINGSSLFSVELRPEPMAEEKAVNDRVIPSPSPQPSPPGRGRTCEGFVKVRGILAWIPRIEARRRGVSTNTYTTERPGALSSSRRAEWFSFSLRERVGVRGKGLLCRLRLSFPPLTPVLIPPKIARNLNVCPYILILILIDPNLFVFTQPLGLAGVRR